MRVGRWLIIGSTGELINECHYANGSLNSNNSDPGCPGYESESESESGSGSGSGSGNGNGNGNGNGSG